MTKLIEILIYLVIFLHRAASDVCFPLRCGDCSSGTNTCVFTFASSSYGTCHSDMDCSSCSASTCQSNDAQTCSPSLCSICFSGRCHFDDSKAGYKVGGPCSSDSDCASCDLGICIATDSDDGATVVHCDSGGGNDWPIGGTVTITTAIDGIALFGQNTSPDQPWYGIGSTACVTDPAPGQTLPEAENTVLADLYSALIRSSPAEKQFHSNWNTLLSTSGSNLCGLYGLWYQMVDPNIQPHPAGTDDVKGWCGRRNNIKTLVAVDLDLIPTSVKPTYDFTYDKIFFHLSKDPGQIRYLSDVTHCHGRNWYAMIAMQMTWTETTFKENWASSPNGASSQRKPFDSVNPPAGVLPQTKCLMSYNPAGVLPSSLARLTSLASLRLRMLGIARQPIPSWIGQMIGLTLLDLSFNSFTSSLPESLYSLTNLAYLHLDDNLLTGTISTLLGKLVNLRTLEIGYHAYALHQYEEYGAVPQSAEGSNMLRGSIPTEICLLTNLMRLKLNNNALTSTLPSCMSKMTALRLLDVQFNGLAGSLPTFYTPPGPTFYTPPGPPFTPTSPVVCPADSQPPWSKLYLMLNNNAFEGTLDSLAYLATGKHAGFNDGLGCVPKGLFTDNIDWISIRGNKFHGTVPTFLNNAQLPLGRLDLSYNSLTGTIPLFLTGATMHVLNLAHNLFRGPMPDGDNAAGEGFYYRLSFFSFSDNFLTGTLPYNIFDGAAAVKGLSLRNNKLKQDIGEVLNTVIGKHFYSYSNYSGVLATFSVLDLSGNSLFGTLPAGGAPFALYLGYTLESSQIQSFILSNNEISGTLPSELATLTGLTTLDLSGNKLSGELPSQALSSLTNLQVLRLSDNPKLAQPRGSSSRRELSDHSSSSSHSSVIPSRTLSRRMSASSSSETSVGFAKSLTRLTLFDVYNTSAKFSRVVSDQLPSSLRTLNKMSNNCYSAKLSDDICKELPNLQTVVLDGLRTDFFKTAECEAPYWSDNNPFGFNGKQSIAVDDSAPLPTIPACLFALTGIKVLHLSLNGLRGSLPDFVSDSLQELVLTHNFLTGTIPLAYQTKTWSKLDLSYNQLKGSIEQLKPPTKGGTINLAINHLSGPVPGQLRTAANVSILEGNLFSCGGGDRSLLPINDPYLEKFSCGSDTYNASLYSCAGVVAVAVVLFLYILFKGERTLAATSVFVWQALTRGLHAADPKEPAVADAKRRDVAHMVVTATLAEESGRVGAKDESSEPSTGGSTTPSPMPSPVPSPISPVILRGLLLFHLIVAVLDVGLVTVVNVLFVIVQQRYGNEVQTAAKTGLSIFKILWNSVLLVQLDSAVLPGLTREQLTAAHKAIYGSRGIFLALLLIFNNIFAPLFASAVADVNCFKDYIYAASAVSFSYFYQKCESFYGSTAFPTCLRNVDVEVPLSFTPAFEYSYLCTSHILTSYVPVFIQSALISTFTNPLLDLALLLAYRLWPAKLPLGLGVVKTALRGVVSPYFLSRRDREANLVAKRVAEAKAKTVLEQDERERLYTLPLVGLRVPFSLIGRKTRSEVAEKMRADEKLDEEQHKLRLPVLGRIPIFWAPRKPILTDEERAARAAKDEERRVQEAKENRKPKFVNADSFLISATSNIIVGLTFGMVAPLLAFVQLASVCFSSLYLEFKVDQFVRHEMDEAEQDEASAASWAVAHHLIPANTKRCLEILVELRRQLVQVIGALLVVFVPVVVLSAKYNVYSYPAAWVTTFSFVRGTVPAVIMLVVWNLALAFLRYVFFTFDEGNEEGKEEDGDMKDVRAQALGEGQGQGVVSANSSSSSSSNNNNNNKGEGEGEGKGDSGGSIRSHRLGEVLLARAASLYAAPPSQRRPPGTPKGESEESDKDMDKDKDKDKGEFARLPPFVVLAFDETESVAASSSGLALRVVFKKDDVQALLKKKDKGFSSQVLEALPVDSGGFARAWASVSVCDSVSTRTATDTEAGAEAEAEAGADGDEEKEEEKDELVRALEELGSLGEFYGVAELEKDAAAMNPHGVEDVEWAIHLFSSIFLGAFLWDCLGGELGWKAAAPVAVVMLVFPSVVTIILSLRSLCYKKGQGKFAVDLATKYEPEEDGSATAAMKVRVRGGGDVETGSLIESEGKEGRVDDEPLPGARAKPISSDTSSSAQAKSSPRVLPVDCQETATSHASSSLSIATPTPDANVQPTPLESDGDHASSSSSDPATIAATSEMQAFAKASHDATMRRLEQLVASMHDRFSAKLEEGLAASALAAADLAQRFEDLRRDAAQTASNLEAQLEAERAERAALHGRLEQTKAELADLRRDLEATTSSATAASATDSSPSMPSLSSPYATGAVATKADLSAMSSRLEAVKSDILALSSSLDETNAAVEGMRAEAALSRRDRGPDSLAQEDRIRALGEALTQTNAELAGLRRDIAGPFLLDNDEEQW